MIIILTLALCILLLLYILITTMDGGVVAWWQSCGHAPCRTSVARRPEPAPTTEGNAGGSDRVQVTFSQHRPPKVKDTLDHDHKSRGWLVKRRRAFCFCVVPEIEINSLLALSGMWSGREAPSPSSTPGGELAVWRGEEGRGGRLVWHQPCRVFGTSVDSWP